MIKTVQKLLKSQKSAKNMVIGKTMAKHGKYGN